MATSKGHMKHPRKGICSTTPKQPRIHVPASVPDPGMPDLIEPHDPHADDDLSPTAQQYHIFYNDDDQSIANVFCFGAFADKISGVVYNDCTGEFPYMSLDGNVCFLSCTTTKQTPSLRLQSQGWILLASWRRTRRTSNTWNPRVISQS